ncbi:MAG: hypothetical protein U0931_11670 [Vulcanimicrobiota bacterium]
MNPWLTSLERVLRKQLPELPKSGDRAIRCYTVVTRSLTALLDKDIIATPQALRPLLKLSR